MKYDNILMQLDRFIFIGFLTLVLQVNPVKSQLSFSDSGQRLGNGTSNSVALGDIDGAWNLDAIAANGSYDSDQDVEVWLNNGKGNFTRTARKLT